MSDAARHTTGRCLCGDVRFKYDPEALRWTGHCHCDSCRRATGSPVTTFIGVLDTGWRWTATEPVAYESSPGTFRYHCGRCGSPVAYKSYRYPGEIHFHAALLIDPTEVKPQAEFHSDERLPWIRLAGDLPQK